MSLIACPECNKQISDTVNVCPNCGFQLTQDKITEIKVKDKKKRTRYRIGCLSTIVIFIFICSFIYKEENTADYFNEPLSMITIKGTWGYKENNVFHKFNFTSSGAYSYSASSDMGQLTYNGKYYFTDSNNIKIYLNSGKSLTAKVGLSKDKEILYYMDEVMSTSKSMKRINE
ncbi:MAG: zinc ribbon domain-containing protein [Bacteroidota bacterium]|nr:zinc ribbon domain-containing protein [bacterium]